MAVVLVAISPGCGGTAGGPDPATSSATDRSYAIRGVVVATDVARRILEINHEAMPRVHARHEHAVRGRGPRPPPRLAPGDRVHGTLRIDRRGYIITALEKG